MNQPEKDRFMLAVAQHGERENTTEKSRGISRGFLLLLAEALSRHLGGKEIRSVSLAAHGDPQIRINGDTVVPDMIVELDDNSRLAVEIKSCWLK